MQTFAPGAPLPPNNWHVQSVDTIVYECNIYVLRRKFGPKGPYKQPRVVEVNQAYWGYKVA